jgi:hypothetical protein
MKKICNTCGEEKPIEEYQLTRPNLRRAKCKTCQYKIAKEWQIKNKTRIATVRSQRSLVIRKTVFNHYGYKCACCGEDKLGFLCIDHMDNNGSFHRKKIKRHAGKTFYLWLIKNHFPAGFQTLCFNCNLAKSFWGKCPHKS